MMQFLPFSTYKIKVNIYNFIRGVIGVILFCLFITTVFGSRIKDLTVVEGSRDNQLVGYGLVTGLAGKGDGTSSIYTKQSISNALKKFGVHVDSGDVKSKNVAAVIVTAEIGPFIKEGSRVPVTVSSLGDASTLQGGILLQTPLYGADGTVYCVAQGPIQVGGFIGGEGGSGGATVQNNHPTVGKTEGIIEREIPSEVIDQGCLNLLLMNSDYVTAVRVAEAVNREYPGVAQAITPNTVNVFLPEKFIGQEMNFIAAIGGIDVIPDISARVIMNERTGTIVATSNVRISTVGVSHGSLTISISQNLNVSQPGALSEVGSTQVTPSTDTNVTEVKGKFQVVDDFPTIERLTTALNALGVTTREMMSILQAIKSSGALQAELIIL